MKRGVEAGNTGDARQQLAGGVDARQRCREMQRREVDNAGEISDHLAIDAHRRRIARTSVHDAMPDRLDSVHLLNRCCQLRFVEAPFRDFELPIGQDVVVPSSLYPRTWMLGWFVRRYVRRWISHG